ncbi:hypothetical protein DTL21_03415 [Bremerella cremea]|uniref:Uncharacterized protein n=1 Tax=Blastopirellula marina TaxID=124 RepID=A0A2S8G6N0_9BACT|nr:MULTISPECIES: hypothetical protein [Pirellulaceae]PQO39804.1 hypothetical protein C5Y83_03415 [Blastopirellula marina]RCS51271.1 hypothetical protein DTL21_03415 [Bremerella cremea]
MSNSIWISDYDVIHRCNTETFQLSIAAFPNRMNAKFHSLPRNWQVVQWELAGIGTRDDFYVRGDDLVERYTVDDLSTEIYNRVLPGRDGVEMILSRQTSLLDSDPGLSLKFYFEDANSISTMNADGDWNPPGLGPTDRADLINPMAAVVGCLDAVQYGLFVYPGDCEAMQVQRTSEEAVEVTLPLFTVHLEKGVIRRSRVRFVRAEGKDAMQQLADKYRAFCESEVPLTT